MFTIVARASVFPPWVKSGAFGQLVLKVQADSRSLRDLHVSCEVAVDRLPAEAKDVTVARQPALRLVREARHPSGARLDKAPAGL